MEQRMSENTKLLLIINTIRKIIDIFLGPFLTAYLFKVAIENIKIISIYNIFSYIAIVIIALFIGRILKNKYEMPILIIISCTIILISSIILVFFTNQYTIVGYNLIFAFFLQFIMVAEEVQTLKFTNSDVINDSNRVETYVLLEMFLNAGRVISYILLFIVGIYNKLYLLEILIIFLVLSIGAETVSLIKFNNE